MSQRILRPPPAEGSMPGWSLRMPVRACRQGDGVAVWFAGEELQLEATCGELLSDLLLEEPVGEVRFKRIAHLQTFSAEEPPPNISKSSHDAKLDAARTTCEEREQQRRALFDPGSKPSEQRDPAAPSRNQRVGA